MTVVLVHGVPETPAVWDELAEALRERHSVDSTRLSPPGFGVASPAGFDATRAGYLRWLVEELEALGEPARLVGHDWGGLHVLGVAMTRPDLIESWVCDVAGILDPGYRWHPLAEQWQRAGDGERAVESLAAMSFGERVDYYRREGMPPAVARRLAPGMTTGMGRCILSLYRSSIQPAMAAAGAALPAATARPGLVVHATEDHNSGTGAEVARSARRAGARVLELPGLGHWWFAQAPAGAADALVDFWTRAADQSVAGPGEPDSA